MAASENFVTVYQVHIPATPDQSACNHMVVKVHHSLANHRSMASEHPLAKLMMANNMRTFDFERLLTEEYGLVVSLDNNEYGFR